MRILVSILVLFISNITLGQNPYARIDGQLRQLIDPFIIEKGREQRFFDYDIKLYQQDSLRKAGQIFDRVYWLDTTSRLATKSLQYRKKIEEKIIIQTRANLKNVWHWKWTGTGWGPTDTASDVKRKRIELTDSTIKFYLNDSSTRQTNYVLTQRFDWINGFMSNLIQYKDNGEEWHFGLSAFGNFTSDYLWIERKSNIIDGPGEAYTIEKKITVK